MKNNNITDRLTFLAKTFDVFETSSDNGSSPIEVKLSELKKEGYETRPIKNAKDSVIALISSKKNEKNRFLIKTSVSDSVFSDMISADPTENKMYLQWMLNVFVRLLKAGDVTSIEAAIRFVDEDLPQASNYLLLFEDNKRKKKFKDLSTASYSLKHVTDPTNINQYQSLAQLFDAVDPFIEREPSAIERTLKKYVDGGQALIPVRDRKFTLYIPKTTAASVVFDKFANWCTAREGNGMFKSYTENNRKPNGKNSDIYIIIDNRFFSGESDELFQIHFETRQLKDRKNGQNVSIFESVLSQSEGLSNFFYEELMEMAKTNKQGIETNIYLDYLIQFGFTESYFELFPEETPIIRIMKKEIPKLPDISRFKELETLIITSAKLVEIHPSIGALKSLEILALTDNKLKTLPKEIGMLTNLKFLNINGNQITEIPDELTYLDKSNGGSLVRIGVNKEDIGANNFDKIKRLLPQTSIN